MGTNPSPPDPELTRLQAAQQGDKEAFSDIVHAYYRLILHVAYRLSGDAQLAEDVAQDTFMRAWQRLPSFQPQNPLSLRAWLSRIAHHRTIDMLRKQVRETELDSASHSSSPSPLATILADEVAAEVQRCISRLPEISRTALVLREFEGFSYAEIAAILDIPVGTVMSRLYHARQRLAAEILSSRESVMTS